jgi:hypothetical protein
MTQEEAQECKKDDEEDKRSSIQACLAKFRSSRLPIDMCSCTLLAHTLGCCCCYSYNPITKESSQGHQFFVRLARPSPGGKNHLVLAFEEGNCGWVGVWVFDPFLSLPWL